MTMHMTAKKTKAQALPAPKPFVKWAGGKRQLINLLLENAPAAYGAFYEPFVGGGALLLNLLPKKVVVSDVNAELINAYQVIRQDVEGLLASLQHHRNEETHFYRVRAQDPAGMSAVERASRFIFLNKTCFNGLYRENSKGQFNVPFGRYKNPNIDDRENLEAIAAYLNGAQVEILCQDFKATAGMAKAGDFVYFDPPYHPISQTASFTRYVRGDFTARDQEELAETFRQLAGRGCQVMLSNSNVPFIKELYRDFNIVEVEAARFINCKAEKRGKGLYEVLVKSY
jgi:DNA adenine methylase